MRKNPHDATLLFLLSNPIRESCRRAGMFEAFAQIASSAEGTGLDRGHCQAKSLSGFCVRQPLQFAKQSNGKKTFPKPRDSVGDKGATLFFGEGLFRGWMVVGEIEGRSWVDVIVVGFKKWSGRAPPSQHHQRFIDRYARHPSCECGVCAKSIKLRKCSLKRLLHCILCILWIQKYSKGRTIDPRPMTLVQFSESA